MALNVFSDLAANLKLLPEILKLTLHIFTDAFKHFDALQ